MFSSFFHYLVITICLHAVLLFYRLIDQFCRVFADGLGNLDLISGRVIPKTLKCYLIPPCLTLSNVSNVSRVKWRNPAKGVALFPTPRCSSY